MYDMYLEIIHPIIFYDYTFSLSYFRELYPANTFKYQYMDEIPRKRSMKNVLRSSSDMNIRMYVPNFHH